MSSRRIAYFVPTLLHLMNCIITQETIFKEESADIIFQDVFTFNEIRDRVREAGIFENVYTFNTVQERAKYRAMSGNERHKVERNPALLFTFPSFAQEYTDLCVNIDSWASKSFYYGLINLGMLPKIHFVSEGTGTYALDFENTRTDKMDHEYYGTKSFLNNIGNTYLYKPELYTGGSKLIQPVALPYYDELDESVRKKLDFIFGQAQPFKQKVIFFEGAFWGDGMLTNEIRLFMDIAHHVGKENIIVKRHPRNPVDRFSPLGFSVMSEQSIPWEIMIKDIDLSKKLLISVASFTCYSAQEMYQRTSQAILLHKLLKGKVYFLENPGYKRFFFNAGKVFNANEIVSREPKTQYELHIALDAISNKIGGFKHDD